MAATVPVYDRTQQVEILAYGAGQTLATSTSSARIEIPAGYNAIVLMATATTFVRFGTVTTDAATTDDDWDVVLNAGVYMPVRVPPGVTHVAGILASSTGSLYVMGVY